MQYTKAAHETVLSPPERNGHRDPTG
ncbi:hypothetical protein XFF6992_170197 [Xanthomonas citri pv. fuscans]|nr:hypothetical protein XFF6990_140077 [Xanthomonas citri pv. fuscans]SOO17604.1 hypothetical protein XFF6992_170197 [Xanthomonas citri pv. fuscans]